jgi:hypothetical protein
MSLLGARQKARLAVLALVTHVNANPSALLPRGPIAKACRSAVRSAITAVFEQSGWGEHFSNTDQLFLVQNHFLVQKLLPPVQWASTASHHHCGQATATFVGVTDVKPLVVDVQWRVCEGKPMYKVEASVDRAPVWQVAALPGDGPVDLQQCPPCVAMMVYECFRFVRASDGHFHGGIEFPKVLMPAALAPVDRLHNALQAATTPAQVWAAVVCAASEGVCGATAAPWRPKPFGLCAQGASHAISLLWVLLASGAKPGKVLRTLYLTRHHQDCRWQLAVATAILAGGDPLRPVWGHLKYACAFGTELRLVCMEVAWLDRLDHPYTRIVEGRNNLWRAARASWCTAAL